MSKTKWMLILAGAACFSHQASGSVISPPITFSTSGDYTNNFVNITAVGSVNYNSGTQDIGVSGVNTAGIARYDTNPGNGTYDNADFLTETISGNLTYSQFNGSSFGYFTRVKSSDNTGILALINANSATQVQLRLFSGASTTNTGSNGTVFYDATFNLATGGVTNATGTGGSGSSNSITAGAPLTVQLAQTGGANPTFNLTISDTDGLVASTGSQATATYTAAGAIALRFFAANSSPATTIEFDNLSAVPEPTSAALLGLGAAALLARRRRNA